MTVDGKYLNHLGIADDIVIISGSEVELYQMLADVARTSRV